MRAGETNTSDVGRRKQLGLGRDPLLFPRHFSTWCLLQADFSLLSAEFEWPNSFLGGDASTFCSVTAPTASQAAPPRWGEHPELSVLCLGPRAHQGTPFRDHLPSQESCSRMASPTFNSSGGIRGGVQLLTPSGAISTCKIDQPESKNSEEGGNSCASFEYHAHGFQADLHFFPTIISLWGF